MIGFEVGGIVAACILLVGAFVAIVKGRSMLEARAERNTEQIAELRDFIKEELDEIKEFWRTQLSEHKSYVDRQLAEQRALLEKELAQLKRDYEDDRKITHERIDRHAARFDRYVEASVNVQTALSGLTSLVDGMAKRIDSFEATIRELLRARSRADNE